MSASSGGDFNFYMGKGELLTGTQPMDWVNKHRPKTTLFSKIPVPPGEDGFVLQADSTTNTGLRWVPHEPIATSLNNSVNFIVEFLKPLVEERRINEAERLKSAPSILYIRPRVGDVITVPFTSSNTVQTLIDHLNKTFLVSLMNGNSQIKLTYGTTILEHTRTFADYNIDNHASVSMTFTSNQSAGKSKTRKNNINRITKGHMRRRTIRK